VEIDNDRNMIEMQLNYEKRLKDEAETSVRWRSEATISRNKNTTITTEYEELQNSLATMRGQQSKFQQTINGLEKDISDLRKEITDRDHAIRDKEKRVHEVQKKNQELDKYKHLLIHKIDELKLQIEPRDREIKKRREQIVEMEKELENLQLTIQQLKLQLSELKDKYHGTDVALKTERNHARSARSHVSMICGDIHKVSGYMQKPVKLKTGVKKLYQMYAEDPELKKQLLLNADIQNEFARQREHLENMAKKTTGGKIYPEFHFQRLQNYFFKKFQLRKKTTLTRPSY
jgi:cilia- and flagella-associated protein 57